MASTSLPSVTAPTSSIHTARAVRNREQQQRAIALKIAGWTYAAIGKELGVSRQYVQQSLVRASAQTLELLYARAKHHCEKCGVKIGTSGHVHHLELRTKDYNALGNLLYICASCHRIEHFATRVYFTELPPGPERRKAGEAFIQPFISHISVRHCMACGEEEAVGGLCARCREKYKAVRKAKNCLAIWQRGQAKNAEHCLTQAIYTIRKHNLKPEDFGPVVESEIRMKTPSSKDPQAQAETSVCLCGHDQSVHAYPGLLGTRCTQCNCHKFTRYAVTAHPHPTKTMCSADIPTVAMAATDLSPAETKHKELNAELLKALKAMTRLAEVLADDTTEKEVGYGGKTVRENIHDAKALIAKAEKQP